MGALTNKPYAFTARSFELKHTESVDVSDALGASIRVDSRGPEVMRIVPRQNDAVNEDWISDKARFQCDGLRRQRLGVPMTRGADSKLQAVTWLQALQAVQKAVKPLKGSEMKALAGARLVAVQCGLAVGMGEGHVEFETGTVFAAVPQNRVCTILLSVAPTL